MFSSESESHSPSMFSTAFNAEVESPSSCNYFKSQRNSTRLAIKASLKNLPTVYDSAEAATVDESHAPTVSDVHEPTLDDAHAPTVDEEISIPLVRAAPEISMPARDQERKYCLECLKPSDTAYSNNKTNDFDVKCITAAMLCLVCQTLFGYKVSWYGQGGKISFPLVYTYKRIKFRKRSMFYGISWIRLLSMILNGQSIK